MDHYLNWLATHLVITTYHWSDGEITSRVSSAGHYKQNLKICVEGACRSTQGPLECRSIISIHYPITISYMNDPYCIDAVAGLC